MRRLIIPLALLAAFMQTTFFSSLGQLASIDLLVPIIILALQRGRLPLGLLAAVAGASVLELYSDLLFGSILAVYVVATALLALFQFRQGYPAGLWGYLIGVVLLEALVQIGLLLALLISGVESHTAQSELGHLWVPTLLTAGAGLLLRSPMERLVKVASYYWPASK